MVRRVCLRRFKRFEDTTFHLPGHIVLAGPNNSGKTTLLQAIAAWSLALRRWKELDDYQVAAAERGSGFGGYKPAPIARQAFAAVPLRRFDLLWNNRQYQPADPIEIEIATDEWAIGMELTPDTTEQIFVRPVNVAPDILRGASLNPVFVPAMTGLSVNEPVYQPALVDELLALAKPGDVLRNLLLEAHGRGEAWQELSASIRKLFRFDLLPPNAAGPYIVAEYARPENGPRFDIASAGSGFQQVLMLLAFLFARPASVLLLDEPDAHLHVILQEAIYGELRAAAARTRSQLVIATHSEVIINSADVRETCVMLDQPRMLADSEKRRTLIESLGLLSHEDVMLAQQAPGILYLEGHTDLELLKAFARVLGHPVEALLTTELFWKAAIADTQIGRSGIKARDHYDSLKLVRDLPALEILDGDSHPHIRSTEISGTGFQQWRWRRYEIESYLVHPAALERFVVKMVGEGGSASYVSSLREYLTANLPPPVIARPLDNHVYLNNTKARKEILPPALSAAGLPGLPYTRYHEIAALMKPDEIHPDIRETLDVIMRAFGR